MGVVAPNGCGLDRYAEALRGGVSGIRHIPLLAELKFGCTVGGVPQGVDEIAEAYFAEDDLMAMNSSHRYGCIAAIDAWTDAGVERPEASDDRVYWEAGAVLGTGIGGMDTAGDRLVPFVDEGRVRRLGSTIVEQVMGSGVSARVAGLLSLGESGDGEFERVQHRYRSDNRRASANHPREEPRGCCAEGQRARVITLGQASTPCECYVGSTMTSRSGRLGR